MIPLLQGCDLVSFDLDGTLAEVFFRRLGLWRSFLRHPIVLKRYLGSVESLRGTRQPHVIRAVAEQIAADSKFDTETVIQILDREIGQRWPSLFKGAKTPAPLLRLIQLVDDAQIPRCIVSDYPALFKLNAMGLTGFSPIIDCQELGALKPLPDGLWAAAAQMGCPPSKILHVGDRWETDGDSAARFGCRFVHIDELPSLI